MINPANTLMSPLFVMLVGGIVATVIIGFVATYRRGSKKRAVKR